MSEGSLIEQSTALLYFVASMALWFLPRNTIDKRGVAALCVVMVAFGAREMDLHRYWTDGSMLKLSFYLGDAPATQKLVGIAVVSAVFVALVHVFRKGVAWVAAGLRSRDPRALTVMLFLVTVVVSKVLDRTASIFTEDLGISLQLSTRALIQATEELLELALPLLVIVGALQHRSRVSLAIGGDVPACEPVLATTANVGD